MDRDPSGVGDDATAAIGKWGSFDRRKKEKGCVTEYCGGGCAVRERKGVEKEERKLERYFRLPFVTAIFFFMCLICLFGFFYLIFVILFPYISFLTVEF